MSFYHGIRKVYHGVRKVWIRLFWTGRSLGAWRISSGERDKQKNRQTDNQPDNYRAFPDFLNPWFSIGLIWCSAILYIKLFALAQ